MVRISIGEFFQGSGAVAAGATIGVEHFRKICSLLPAAARMPGKETIVGLDFEGIEDATPSYIKATVLAVHQSGRYYAKVLSVDEHEELSGVKLLNVVAVVLRPTAEVQECIFEVFGRRGLAILCGKDFGKDRFDEATLLGNLDDKVSKTLEISCRFPEFQAGDLSAATDEQISVTGWNNRLAELHRHRLIRRRQDGRVNRFFPLTTKIQFYGQVLPRK